MKHDLANFEQTLRLEAEGAVNDLMFAILSGEIDLQTSPSLHIHIEMQPASWQRDTYLP